MSSADVAALLQNLPTARLVFDRFHLLKPLELNELLVLDYGLRDERRRPHGS